MLYTKCILALKSPKDGTRISVMSRHKHQEGIEDGIPSDKEITPEFYNEWTTRLAPPEKLVGDYYRRGLEWEMFERRYFHHLRFPEIAPRVRELAVRALREDITLLCVEEGATHCHRRLLAEECQRYEPDLKIEHK
jgi:uncharacterized protein YeaO (DUF488 family)